MTAPVDLEALLCALVLAPRTFARNRFFWLFTEQGARRARSRATQLRTIVRHLAAGDQQAQGEVVGYRVAEDGGIVLTYRVSTLGLTRTANLEPLEVALVRFALHQAGAERVRDGVLQVTEADRMVVEGALAKLGNHLDVSEQGSLAPQTNPTPD